MFRHGLRVSEACGLRVSQVDIESRVLHVARLKQGLSTTHPLRGDEIRAIKAWLTERARMKPETEAFFLSERRGPLSRKTVWFMIGRYGKPQACPWTRTPTCSTMRAVLLSLTRARTRGCFRTISAIGIFSIPSNTPPPIPHGLNGCGDEVQEKAWTMEQTRPWASIRVK